MADVDRIANVKAGDVDHDVVGDLVSFADQFQLVAHDVEHRAALEAGRLVFIREDHGHRDVHLGIGRQAQEVDMKRAIADRVEGHVLRQGAQRSAAQLDLDHRVEEVASAQLLAQQLFFDVDGHRGLVAAVDHGGGAAFTTKCAGGSLASPLTRLSRQVQRIAHTDAFRIR